MALLSWMPRVRSLYSRYFSTMGASSLWALAVFWKRAESETISGEARALLSSSYFNSVWSRRSNMGSLPLYGNPAFECETTPAGSRTRVSMAKEVDETFREASLSSAEADLTHKTDAWTRTLRLCSG